MEHWSVVRGARVANGIFRRHVQAARRVGGWHQQSVERLVARSNARTDRRSCCERLANNFSWRKFRARNCAGRNVGEAVRARAQERAWFWSA